MKETKLILVGGFLGTGKTTLLRAAACVRKGYWARDEADSESQPWKARAAVQVCEGCLASVKQLEEFWRSLD